MRSLRSPSSDTPLIALARVTRPVGLKGGVRVQLLCDGPERLRDVKQVYRGRSPEGAVAVSVEEVSVRGNGVVVFFGDCTSRPAAEGIRDQYLFIAEEESVGAPDGTPRIHELLDCEVLTKDGRPLGKVTNVFELSAYKLLGVTRRGGSREVLVPYVEAWVVDVDPQHRRVTLVSDELFDEA